MLSLFLSLKHFLFKYLHSIKFLRVLFLTSSTLPNPPFPRTFSILNASKFIEVDANISIGGLVTVCFLLLE